MKIVLNNFNYRGRHYELFECELPNVKDIDDVPEEKLIQYIIESLDEVYDFLKVGET